ncbi:hypothetical protein Hypma_001442 [Hypsizygus marmoreus]|uniref:Uncharacterized protein n=1 Tax=Hypsizygus marmoreus TaxID=39966 RepID=A0A369K3Q0_HYPMA|nr:hypothetical protein Hypma_001442 [Hypsizygus marmoreus]
MTAQIQTAQVVLALPGGNWGRVVYLFILAALASLYADTQPTFHNPFKPPSQISFLSRLRLNPSPTTPLPPSPTLPSPAQFIQEGSSCTPFRLAVLFVMGASLLVVLWLVPHLASRLRISCSRSWRLCLQTPVLSSGSAPDPEVVPPVGQCPLIACPPSPEPPNDPPPNPGHSVSAGALAPEPQSPPAPSPSWMDPEDEQPPPPPPPDDGTESAASLPRRSPRSSWLWWMVLINILLTIGGVLYALLASIVTIATPAPLVPVLISLSAIFVTELLVHFTSWIWRSTEHTVRDGITYIEHKISTRDRAVTIVYKLIIAFGILSAVVGFLRDIGQLGPIFKWIAVSFIKLVYYGFCARRIASSYLCTIVEWTSGYISSSDFKTNLLTVGPSLTVRLYCFSHCSDAEERHAYKSLDSHGLEQSCPVSRDNDQSASAIGTIFDEYPDGSNYGFAWPWLMFFLMASHYAVSIQLIRPATYEWAMQTMVMSISVAYALQFMLYIPLSAVHKIWRVAKFLRTNMRTFAVCACIALVRWSLRSTVMEEPGFLQQLNLMRLLQTSWHLLPIVQDAWFAAWHYIMELDVVSKILMFGPPLVLQFHKFLADWRRARYGRTLDVMEGGIGTA